METEKKEINVYFTKMAALCSRSEQCSNDIRKKLRSLGANSIVAENVIDLLEKENFLNDERYAKSFTRDKFKFNKWGKIKIRHYLKMKGLPDKIIENGLEEIDESQYRELLLKTLKEKAKAVKNKNKFEKMGQVIRFAQSRGFEPEIIHRYLNEVVK